MLPKEENYIEQNELNKEFKKGKDKKRREKRDKNVNFRDNQINKNEYVDQFEFTNFFELKDEDLKVINPYSLEEALKRINSIEYDDIKDDLKYFQDNKNLELRNYDDEHNVFTLDNIKFVTSTKNDDDKKDFYLLNDLSDYLISDEDIRKKEEMENEGIEREKVGKNEEKKDKEEKEEKEENDESQTLGKKRKFEKIKLYIQTNNIEHNKKALIIKCFVNAKKLSKNIINNFIKKSKFEKADIIRKEFKKRLKYNSDKCKLNLIIKIPINSINKIYYNFKKGEYFLDLQNPPIFKTNFFIGDISQKKTEDYNKDKDKIEKSKEKEEKPEEKPQENKSEGKSDDETEDKSIDINLNKTEEKSIDISIDKDLTKVKEEDIEEYLNLKDENSLFPFRDFEDELSNLKYRHFIIMLQKEVSDEEDINENVETNFDSNKILYYSLENIFTNKKGELEKYKYIKKHIQLKTQDENMKNLSYFFRYKQHEEIKEKLLNLYFLKNLEKNEDEEVIKLFYQTAALISENILSYFNAIQFLDNLLMENKYRKDIFEKCSDENFPIFFNLCLTKLLDKYQNSMEEKSLKSFEEEMSNQFKSLFALYENEGLEIVLKPSKNDILMRVQRCVITPTYILFTPYVLEEGNRIIRQFFCHDNDYSYINYAMLCTFKMDSLEEARWNNNFLMEYIKFILSKGFYIGEKKFSFFNYSQSQFRNMSCWLVIKPKKILKQIGDFSKIKQLSKYAARISQTLTTTIQTIQIQKNNINFIPDIKSKPGEGDYTFSDGVGKISYDLAKGISEKLKLDYVPSCFQGRFLGCKGVWTTMWHEEDSQIYCRDSQVKFKVEPTELNYFELCDYSRYIQSYLNRQIILLLSSLGIKDETFLNKLDDYNNKLNDQQFVLSLIHYPEWNQMMQIMNSSGINMTNDRLIKSLIESNLSILYNDVKKKARIYVEESAYVIGIMDEYDILEYGEAFLQIKRPNFNKILDKKCTVAKCPCLHPGDIRVLTFKKYNEDDPSTEKYKIFNQYENVIIFPSKGKRPHPNECSGSDLDGDNYFIFYDEDLVPRKMFEPMDYSVEKKKEPSKVKFTINDVIQYFAEYTNLNNLGIIGDAHLAISDKDSAKSKLAIKIAEKFSKAVDAPKTGDKVVLDEDETPKKFPHYMGKPLNKSYHSTSVLGKLYDKIEEIMQKRINKKQININTFDEDLILDNWEDYAFLALLYYRDYYKDLVDMLKKNEIRGESILLTGNNIDNENSILSKKKHNYDLREKIGLVIHDLFVQNKNKFYEAIQHLLIINEDIKNNKKINWIFDKKDLINNDSFFTNNLNKFASACYMISYNILDLKKNENKVKKYGKICETIIKENLIIENDFEELNDINEYYCLNMGIDSYECSEALNENLLSKTNKENDEIKNIIDIKIKDMDNFVKELKNTSIPKEPSEENQYRILSFPWCISGHILSNIKFLNLKV